MQWNIKHQWWQESTTGYRASKAMIRDVTVFTAWYPRLCGSGDNPYARVCYERLGNTGTAAEAQALCQRHQDAQGAEQPPDG